LKNIGRFPNVSAIEFYDNKLYIASRTKSRIAIIDYSTLGLINEFTTVNKPVEMKIVNGNLYVLGSQYNVIQKRNTDYDRILDNIELQTGGFSKGLNIISGTSLAVVTDIKKNMYSIVDLNKGKLLKTYSMNVPLKEVIIADKVKLFD